VISLARSIERRHKIEAAFETLNLEFSYIDAIDARAVSADTILKQTDPVRTKKRLYREMTLGEYACALSHQKAYRAFLETDQPFALFFEDDAIIDTRLKTYLQSEQGGQQDIVLFYHSKARAYGAPKSIGQGMHLRQLARSAVGAVAYGINRKRLSI
jgi:glycosyl transferase family 25